MNETIVIYHGGCRDGFCAAWVYNKHFIEHYEYGKNALANHLTYHPGFYGQEPPDVKDKNVVILDFCYPLEVMKIIVRDCESLTWIDHHKTAQPFNDWLENQPVEDDFFRNIKFVFQNDKSGAGLTWNYFFPNEPRPWIVDYVEDRDLWAKKLPSTNNINAYIATLKFDFGVWNTASDLKLTLADEYGYIAEMKTEQYVNEVCKNVYFVDMHSPGYTTKDSPHGDDSCDIIYNEFWKRIPTVNICQVDCSEVLHELCKRYPESPFSLYWFKRQDGMYQYGLRSIGDFDVSSVAKLLGGGGHRNASGFQLNYLLEELK
jgi:oligoribonuclease NrnB/cAMP/cGMP phosphodiesterase (DHH superfamily)